MECGWWLRPGVGIHEQARRVRPVMVTISSAGAVDISLGSIPGLENALGVRLVLQISLRAAVVTEYSLRLNESS